MQALKPFIEGLVLAAVLFGLMYLMTSCASELPCTKDETYRMDIPELARHSPHFRNCHEENR